MCRVEFAAWGLDFVVIGLNSSPLGWVVFAVVGLNTHHGFHSLSLGCIHQVGLGLSPSGWIRGWVGYSPWLGFTHCHWVGFVAIGLDSPWLGFIRRCWAGFAIVGLSLTVIWLHSPLLHSILPHWPTH